LPDLHSEMVSIKSFKNPYPPNEPQYSLLGSVV
jgi:hypothetical protein